jgi:hypothetical protein
MTKNAQRLSQVVSTFGPGAMVDLPTRSVLVGGLELWEMKGDSFTTIQTAYYAAVGSSFSSSRTPGPIEEPLAAHAAVAEAGPGAYQAISAPVFPAYSSASRSRSLLWMASLRASPPSRALAGP